MIGITTETAIGKVGFSAVGTMIATVMTAQAAVTCATATRTEIHTAPTAGLIQVAVTAGTKTAPAACRAVIRITTGMLITTGTTNAIRIVSAIRITVAPAVRVTTAIAIPTAAPTTIVVHPIAGTIVSKMTATTVIPVIVVKTKIDTTSAAVSVPTTGTIAT